PFTAASIACWIVPKSAGTWITAARAVADRMISTEAESRGDRFMIGFPRSRERLPNCEDARCARCRRAIGSLTRLSRTRGPSGPGLHAPGHPPHEQPELPAEARVAALLVLGILRHERHRHRRHAQPELARARHDLGLEAVVAAAQRLRVDLLQR